MDLTLCDIMCARGGVTVLQGISFSLQPGHTLILQGPNGIGKTTLLRTIAGLQPPQSGKISAPNDAFAYTGHADAIKSTLTLGENLAFWAAIFGTKDIGPAVTALQLDHLQSRKAANLSAGQKRRLGLARLLVTGRPIWLLDEPTVSLDAASTELFAAMIAGHLEKGGSAIIASHLDLDLPQSARLDLTPHAAGKSLQSSVFDAVTA